MNSTTSVSKTKKNKTKKPLQSRFLETIHCIEQKKTKKNHGGMDTTTSLSILRSYLLYMPKYGVVPKRILEFTKVGYQ